MIKTRILIFICLLISASAGIFPAQKSFEILKTDNPKIIEWNMKMRILEGIKEGTSEPAKFVTSSFLQYMISASIQTEFDLAEQQKQIRKIFNLKDVRLLTEADFGGKKGGVEKPFHIFRLDSKEYLILITPIDLIKKQQFRIEVYEQSEKGKTNLLDTEFSIPTKNLAVFGFEDTQGKPYFLSFHISQWSIAADNISIVVTEHPKASEEPVRAIGVVMPPKLIKLVDPIYPEIARQANVEGVVILEATTDIFGRIQSVKTLRSIPLLDQAAIDAVRQWVYEPMIIEGRPRGVVFTVTVRFSLNDKTSKPDQIKEGEPLRLSGKVPPPKLLKPVDPIYPEIARQTHVEGFVILEVTTDISGRVQNVKILRSIPLLDQAAIDAVRQWGYEPVIINDKPIPVTFTVTVRFKLDAHLKPAEVTDSYAFKLPEGMKPPKRTKYIAPVYPAEAIKAQAQGPVVLDATTDESGKLSHINATKSIPLLDKAAIDAVKQWEFEPALVGGKPTPVALTITLIFYLNKEAKAKVGGVVGGVIKPEEAKKLETEPLVKAEGDIKPPKRIKAVDPVYPEEARKNGIEGIVVLECTTDTYGRVKNVKALRSIPELDQAAIDAVRQWVYEPFTLKGKPQGVIFTVTVNFKLN
jgi:TonB family protein